MQDTKDRYSSSERHSEERSTDVEEDIKKLMGKKTDNLDKKMSVSLDQADTTISLLRQLALQYDELEAFFKSHDPKVRDDFPAELLTELVKSSKISPTLCKMVESVTEEAKKLRRENELLKVSEKSTREQLDNNTGSHRSLKLEVKYLNQALKEATKEIKKQKDEAAAQRKRILEMETSLEAQKKIAKSLLQDKKVSNKETDIHEEEKQILQDMIKHKDAEVERAKREKEEMAYEKQKIRREYEVLHIQYSRLKKRAELKEKALYSCTEEMELLIKQMDKLSKSDMQKKERLEYMEINKKKRLYDSHLGNRAKEQPAYPVKGHKVQAAPARYARAEQKPKGKPIIQPEVIPDETDQTETSEPANESITDIPISFSQAVDNASVPDLDSISSDRTATSYKDMQRKTEEMSKKLKDLENLLSEIKRSNDSELDKVEEKINYKTKRT
ncbi:hypothetical protein NEAUS03_1693 [Nematocida ausubeli]|nr:hypothetical protein NEAUS03_1693 [Nematocida ausubeli]